MQPNYRIEEYVAADGTAPFSRWLSQLSDLRAKAKILIRIKRAESGNVGQHRSVGGGVMEMIVDTGPGYRVYFAAAGAQHSRVACGWIEAVAAARHRIGARAME